MKVFQNGTLLRTLPITTGKPGFTTRSGTKVIIEKFREKRMNSETVGIAEGNPEYYDIDDVEYAMRLTYSGEFIHAAPWSVGSQGSANVSPRLHRDEPANAAWLYNISKRGDVVEYVGSDRPMTHDQRLRRLERAPSRPTVRAPRSADPPGRTRRPPPSRAARVGAGGRRRLEHEDGVVQRVAGTDRCPSRRRPHSWLAMTSTARTSSTPYGARSRSHPGTIGPAWPSRPG